MPVILRPNIAQYRLSRQQTTWVWIAQLDPELFIGELCAHNQVVKFLLQRQHPTCYTV